MNQLNEKWIVRDESVYQIKGAYRPLVVTMTSKISAQRLMAQLAKECGLQDQGALSDVRLHASAVPWPGAATLIPHFGAPFHAERRAWHPIKLGMGKRGSRKV